MSRRRRGAPGELAPPPGGTLARSLLSAGMHCWQAGRAQLAVQAAAALLAGVAPVATAWLLRAILDDLATGHPKRVVAFFAAGCSACPERVPAFLDYLRVNQVTRDAVLAVITSSQPEPVSYQERLAEVAPVCVEPHDGEVNAAFNVRAFPAFCVLDGAGSVIAFSHEPAALPALAAAVQS